MGELVKNQDVQGIIENTSTNDEISFSQEAVNDTENNLSNDLKEFGVDTEEPDLFSSENDNTDTESLLNNSENTSEEDDLEIPAFLRRQKN